jgi:hypothetical protein
MLFVLHANKLSGPQTFNLWVVTASPIVIWFFFFVCGLDL